MTHLLDPSRFHIHHHAAARAVEMGIDPFDVAVMLTSPDEERTPGPASKYHDSGRVFYDRGDYTAVIQPGPKVTTVITFLWRYAEGWEKSYRDNPYSDRTLRATSNLPRKTA